MDLCTRLYGENHDYFEKKGCEHTALEIAHQPEMWRKLCDLLASNTDAINQFMKRLPKDIRIIVTGAGSSGFVARAAAGFTAESGGKLCEAIHTTDIVSSPKTTLEADKPTLLISFARSGNSPESVGAVEYARKIVKELYEVAIVCDGESKLAAAARESKHGLVLVMPEGTNDKGFAMTSSVTTMMFAGFALLNAGKMDKITKTIQTCANLVEEKGREIAKTAETCAAWDFERAWYLGSGALAAVVQEGALKMMELTYGAVSAGYNNAPEFRHGPKTVINPKTLTVHFVSNDSFTAKYDMDLLNEVCSERKGNKVVSICNSEKPLGDWNCIYSAEGFGKEIAAGIQGLLFMQLLSVYKSLALGVKTDNPSPNGLVNRVVQGVTVYPL